MAEPILRLVACVGQKATSPTSARDLYCSTWFAKARTYVEVHDGPWYILSAAHGLLHPDQVIAPYDLTLTTMSASERRAWGVRVVEQLQGLAYPASAPVEVLAGRHYRLPLARWLGERAVVPMEGLAIGHQLAWLTAANARAKI